MHCRSLQIDVLLKLIIKAILTRSPALPSTQKLHGSNGQPLYQLVAEGLAAKAPSDVVDAAIKLKEVGWLLFQHAW